MEPKKWGANYILRILCLINEHHNKISEIMAIIISNNLKQLLKGMLSEIVIIIPTFLLILFLYLQEAINPRFLN